MDAAAVRDLGDEIVRLAGPDEMNDLDLADPPADGQEDPGSGRYRNSTACSSATPGIAPILTEEQLPSVWAIVNGLLAPIVLYRGRIVATWEDHSSSRRTDIEVRMLDPYPPPPSNPLRRCRRGDRASDVAAR